MKIGRTEVRAEFSFLLFNALIFLLRFSGAGIKMLSGDVGSAGRELAVILAGPAVNILTWALLSLTGRCGYFSQLSLAEGLFNLLPYDFLDGGAAIRLFTEGTPHEREAAAVRRISAILITAAVVSYLVHAV